MKKPILVVLAAGMGSRYGGLKQMDAIGQSGEALLDYSVFDAKRSGFGKVVFIIRADIEQDFKDIVLKRFGHALPCDLAFQELDSLIPPDALAKSKAAGRSKPWGTTHALLCAEKYLDAPFAVINADDFYGRPAIAAMGKWLSGPDAEKESCIVPYNLHKTLSPIGTVTRGVCKIEGGYLASVEELKKLARDPADGKIYNTDGEKRYLPDDTPVSMNCWGYPLQVLPHLHTYFEDFLASSASDPKAECFIPSATDWLIRKGYTKVRVVEANSDWFGVTYKEDKEPTVQRIRALVTQGEYPASLWG
ncbi:MAG: hypothetical protein LBM77_02160 [Spirochaetaceae bacterium]|jgi:NDP-sugar pyrophosphorylase family protein|nr:hypothetical protein [Spirochaetaceae bacterium]